MAKHHDRDERAEEPAGRSPQDFARAAGISRPLLYCLPTELRPVSLKIGRRVVIIESPATWLARLAVRGHVETVKSKVAA